MAEAYKNGYQDVGTSYTSIYTTPASTEGIVKTIRVTNVDGTNSANIFAQILDSDLSTAAEIANAIQVPAGSSIELCGDSLMFLETGDAVQLKASAASDLEAFISILEIS